MITVGCLIVQAFLVALEVWLFTALPLRPALMLSVHTVAAVAYAFAFARSLGSTYPLYGAALLGGAMALFLPVVGACCALLVALLLLYKPLPAGDLLEEFAEHITISNDATAKQGPAVPGLELTEAARIAEPLVDMLSTTDPDLKVAVLDAIAKRNKPELVPYIKKALEDPRPEVYQFAFGKVAKLQHDHELEITRAAEAAKAAPENLEAHLRLAGSYSSYLGSGLVDKPVVRFYQSQLQKVYDRILSLSPDDGETLENLGELSLRSEQWEEALGAFKRLQESRPNNLAAELGVIKVLYSQGRYQEMFEDLRRLRERVILERGPHTGHRSLVDWWLFSEMSTTERLQ